MLTVIILVRHDDREPDFHCLWILARKVSVASLLINYKHWTDPWLRWEVVKSAAPTNQIYISCLVLWMCFLIEVWLQLDNFTNRILLACCSGYSSTFVLKSPNIDRTWSSKSIEGNLPENYFPSETGQTIVIMLGRLKLNFLSQKEYLVLILLMNNTFWIHRYCRIW